MANEAMSEEQLELITLRSRVDYSPWSSVTPCDSSDAVADVRILLAALREAQSRLADAEYWCQQIRRHDGEYEEPRDAYRTFCKTSDLYQQAQERAERAEEAGYKRGIADSVKIVYDLGDQSYHREVQEAMDLAERYLLALLPPDAPTEDV